MAPVAGTPPWDALVTELGNAPSDRVVAEPARSTVGLWALWIALLAGMFAPMIVGGRVARVVGVGGFFPWWALLVCLGVPVMLEIRRRGLRAGCVPLAALGLRLIEAPAPGILRRFSSDQLALRGRRWDHAVFVEVDTSFTRAGATGRSLVTVAASSPRFELAGKDGRLLAGAGAPAPVVALLEAIGQGPWDDVAVTAGPEGISVRRVTTWYGFRPVDRERPWLHDLWLAEHLARVVS